jgi:hypothetical protein
MRSLLKAVHSVATSASGWASQSSRGPPSARSTRVSLSGPGRRWESRPGRPDRNDVASADRLGSQAGQGSRPEYWRHVHPPRTETYVRTEEGLVRKRVKFRGRAAGVTAVPDETLLGFAFPREERAWLVAREPEKSYMPEGPTSVTTGSGPAVRD